MTSEQHINYGLSEGAAIKDEVRPGVTHPINNCVILLMNAALSGERSEDLNDDAEGDKDRRLQMLMRPVSEVAVGTLGGIIQTSLHVVDHSASH